MRAAEPPTAPILIAPLRVVQRQSSDIIATDDPDVTASLRLIRDHAHEAISVGDLLREVPISRKTLDRRFQKLFGRTPAAEIMRVRAERAKGLLIDTIMPVKMIARQLGFLSQRKFASFFKRQTGLTPDALSAKWRFERGRPMAIGVIAGHTTVWVLISQAARAAILFVQHGL